MIKITHSVGLKRHHEGPPRPRRKKGVFDARVLFVHLRVRFRGASRQGCDRISDEMVDAFFRLAPKHGFDPKDPRGLRDDRHDEPHRHRRRNARPEKVTNDLIDTGALRSRTSATSRKASTGRTPRSRCCCIPSRPTSPRASMRAAAQQGRRRGRPGHHVRLRLPRDARPDAGADLIAHLILRLISEARKAGKEPMLGPDAKSQVTLRYEDGKPVAVTQIVVSTSTSIEAWPGQCARPSSPMCARRCRRAGSRQDHLAREPHRQFVIGGPDGDCGLTGRKIIVDTYGGAARMAAARSRARTRPRSTARRPMPRAISRRTWSPRALPTAARSSSPTRSACQIRSRSM